jgi:hypothetical protein
MVGEQKAGRQAASPPQWPPTRPKVGMVKDRETVKQILILMMREMNRQTVSFYCYSIR